MKDYKRWTDKAIAEMLRNTEEESWDSDNIEAQCYIRLAELEDKIESGELCNREEVRKETVREIAEMLKAAKGVVKVHFEAYDELIENIYGKYGIESVGNSDKLGGRQ